MRLTNKIARKVINTSLVILLQSIFLLNTLGCNSRYQETSNQTDPANYVQKGKLEYAFRAEAFRKANTDTTGHPETGEQYLDSAEQKKYDVHLQDLMDKATK